ncbi:MAG TPA: glycosyltransferase [Steroidobacteraceae bacterium]|jgi:glycosyltransferase involved in cell wall biosynthesis|nr:glycosyltransferase [Steroidobacteraceae bacterium]
MTLASNPLISIVTVCRNAQATVGDTLASVARQQHDFEIEYLVVDGNSSDSTRSIIDRWAQQLPYLRRIYEPDEGIFDAMNKGLRAATGEYVLFLNADDFLTSADILARAMSGRRPDSTPLPDLIVGDVAMGRLQTRGIWRHRRAPRRMATHRGTGRHPIHQAQFTRRTLLLSVGGFDTRCRLSADTAQYYDLEREFAPTIRFLSGDVAFMRAGGAANAGLGAVWGGSLEIFRHLRPKCGAIRAARMVLGKTLQALLEVRYGDSGHTRWFTHAQTGNQPE